MEYVWRDENKIAHILASMTLHDDLDRVWLYEAPDCIREFFNVEFSALHPLI